MTDEADGDRDGDPSDASEEEDPFIYPLADDDAEGAGSAEADADVADAGASEGAESAESGATADAAEPGDAAETTSADTGAAGGADRSATGSTDAGRPSSPGEGVGAGPSRRRSGSERDRSAGRTASSSARSPAGSGSTAGPTSDRSRAAGASTSTDTSRRTTDPGRRATDGRSHASPGQPHQPGRPAETARPRGGTAGGPAAPTGTGREGVSGWIRWFWTTEEGSAVYVRDVATSVAAVLLVGLVLFAVSGIWPPMVAVESGSMEPNLEVGDLVFVVDNERFAPDDAVEHDDRTTGIVPADVANETGRSSFGGPGDVVVYRPDGNDATTPVIHRAMLWVEADENWYDRADPEAVGDASDCRELNHCPAPHAGFITKGDANRRYDQQTTLSAPVRPEWIVGTAEVRIPYLGHIRLAFAGQVAPPLQQDPWAAAAASPPGSQTAPPTPSHPTPETTSASGSPARQGPPAYPGPHTDPGTGSSAGAVV